MRHLIFGGRGMRSTVVCLRETCTARKNSARFFKVAREIGLHKLRNAGVLHPLPKVVRLVDPTSMFSANTRQSHVDLENIYHFHFRFKWHVTWWDKREEKLTRITTMKTLLFSFSLINKGITSCIYILREFASHIYALCKTALTGLDTHATGGLQPEEAEDFSSRIQSAMATSPTTLNAV